MEPRAADDYLGRLDTLLRDVVTGPPTVQLVAIQWPPPGTRPHGLYPYGVFDRRAARRFLTS